MSLIRYKDGTEEEIDLEAAEILDSGIVLHPSPAGFLSLPWSADPPRRFLPHSEIEGIEFGEDVEIIRPNKP